MNGKRPPSSPLSSSPARFCESTDYRMQDQLIAKVTGSAAQISIATVRSGECRAGVVSVVNNADRKLELYLRGRDATGAALSCARATVATGDLVWVVIADDVQNVEIEVRDPGQSPVLATKTVPTAHVCSTVSAVTQADAVTLNSPFVYLSTGALTVKNDATSPVSLLARVGTVSQVVAPGASHTWNGVTASTLEIWPLDDIGAAVRVQIGDTTQPNSAIQLTSPGPAQESLALPWSVSPNTAGVVFLANTTGQGGVSAGFDGESPTTYTSLPMDGTPVAFDTATAPGQWVLNWIIDGVDPRVFIKRLDCGSG